MGAPCVTRRKKMSDKKDKEVEEEELEFDEDLVSPI